MRAVSDAITHDAAPFSGAPVRWPAATVIVGLVWVIGWAAGAVNAVQFLTGGYRPTPLESAGPAAAAAVREAVAGLAVPALAVLGARAVGVSAVDLGLRRPIDQRGRSHAVSGLGQLDAAGVFVLAYGVLGAVTAAVPTHAYPYPTGHWAAVPALVGAVLAGPTEELALVALPTALFRRAGLPWPLIAAIAVGLRLPFHLYYGWGTVGVACWSLIVWAWYARTGRLWGPIIAHSAIDVVGVTVALGGRHHLGLGLAELAAAAVTATVLTSVWSRRLRRGRRVWNAPIGTATGSFPARLVLAGPAEPTSPSLS